MATKIYRTWDVAECLDILLSNDIWPLIAEDDADIKNCMPDVINDVWLAIEHNGSLVGVCCIHSKNSVTAQAHIQILPQYRKEASLIAGAQILDWIKINTSFKLLLTEVPTIYPNVISYLKTFDFKESGLLEKSYKKNGKLVDLMILTRGL